MNRAWPSVVALSIAFFSAQALAQEKSPLSAADAQLLERLLKAFLYNPTEAQRVRVATTVRTAWGNTADVELEGWLAGDAAKPSIFSTDGAVIPAPPPEKISNIDFIKEAAKRFDPNSAGKAKTEEEERAARFGTMHKTASGQLTNDDLAQAAWLHALGDDRLAAHALAAARKVAQDPEAALRSELAWIAYAGMVHAYIVRADDDAQADAERLMRLYAKEAKQPEFAQAQQILAELKRRKENGTFGKTPEEKWADGFDSWGAKKKTTFLIASLDEVDVRQFSQPGWVPMEADRRVTTLIQIGDAAVPDLIDALEKDERLTRSVHFWRDFGRQRTVLSVREASLAALMSILKIRAFEPRATGDNFTSHGPEAGKEMAERLRKYWKENSTLTPEERMMKTLTSESPNFEANREAALHLAHLGDPSELMPALAWLGVSPQKRENPAIAKFSNPTVAEAILAAMDAELKQIASQRDDSLLDYNLQRAEDAYLKPLEHLGDKRIAAELVKRSAAAKTVRMRRKYAFVAHVLGSSQPLNEFANEFHDDKIKLPANGDPNRNEDEQPGTLELLGIVDSLGRAGTPEADHALFALADPKHAGWEVARKSIVERSVGRSRDDGDWCCHPYCLLVLRRALDDRTLTGGNYEIKDDTLTHSFPNGMSSRSIPDVLAEAKDRLSTATGRRCDEAAEKINELAYGLPFSHPLLRDSATRMDRLKAVLDRGIAFRTATEKEARALDVFAFDTFFIPVMPSLSRAATADDVRTGKAVFQLDGKGQPSARKLPAIGTVAGEDGKGPEKVLVLQAEFTSDGKEQLGLASRHDLQTVAAEKVTNITPLAELK